MIKNLWPKDILEAKKIQDVLRKRVKIIPLKKTPELIAGVDAAFTGDKVIAVAVLYEYPELKYLYDAFLSKKYDSPISPDCFHSGKDMPLLMPLKN
jgi:deoxyribonuclease V